MDVKKMTDQELKDYVNNTYDVCVELIRRAGYYPKWAAIDVGFKDCEGAIKVASAIANGYDEYVDQCLIDLWDESVIDAAGISEDEYEENPETPLWDRDDVFWNEETESWEEK